MKLLESKFCDRYLTRQLLSNTWVLSSPGKQNWKSSRGKNSGSVEGSNSGSAHPSDDPQYLSLIHI